MRDLWHPKSHRPTVPMAAAQATVYIFLRSLGPRWGSALSRVHQPTALACRPRGSPATHLVLSCPGRNAHFRSQQLPPPAFSAHFLLLRELLEGAADCSAPPCLGSKGSLHHRMGQRLTRARTLQPGEGQRPPLAQPQRTSLAGYCANRNLSRNQDLPTQLKIH